MEDMLHHLGCIAPYKKWDELPTSTGEGFLPSTVSWTSLELKSSFLSARRPELPPEETEALSGFFWVGSGVFQGEDRVHEQCFQLNFMRDTFFHENPLMISFWEEKLRLETILEPLIFTTEIPNKTLESSQAQPHVSDMSNPVITCSQAVWIFRWFWDGSGPGGPTGVSGEFLADKSNGSICLVRKRNPHKVFQRNFNDLLGPGSCRLKSNGGRKVNWIKEKS